MTVMVVACAGIAPAQTNARQIVSMLLVFTWRPGGTNFYNSHSDESSQKAKSVGQVCATGAAVPLDETGVEFDEDKIDRIVNDVRDEVHLNAGRATRGKDE